MATLRGHLMGWERRTHLCINVWGTSELGTIGFYTEYIDAHCWRFTPASFRLLVSDLLNFGLINSEIEAEFDTTGCEFYVALGKKSDAPMKLDRLTALQTRKFENA